jgi:FAD/FMN-containing dehydrogenase
MGLIRGFAGEQITASDSRYDEARTIFNAMVDRRPAVIARCTSPEDVALAIAYARDEQLPLAVRAGGHSVAGMSMVDDGVVIDVRPMAKVEIDARNRVAKVQGGAIWAEFDRAAQAYGLATTGGRVSTTGVTGFTLGGGSGWMERRHGLAVDNLLAVELVTADGDFIRASEHEHSDLLWAHKGGGGNFGAVTQLEFRLHEFGPMIYGGLAAYDPADGERVATAVRDFYASAPDEAGIALAYLTAPPEPFIPAEWQGRPVMGIAGLWAGPVEEGRERLQEVLEAAQPIVNLFGEMPYAELQAMIDDPPGKRNYWTAEYLTDLPDSAVRAYCEYSEGLPLGYTQSLLIPWGGAVARGGDGTPLTNRDAGWVVHPFCVWEGEERDEEHFAWGRAARDVFAEHRTGVTYLNFVGDEGADRVRAAFGPDYDRLAELKATWDPDNVFRGNQNIVPATATA